MELPARCGRYELMESLGGGMAEVYRARDTVIGRTVAVKVLGKEGSADRETKARFLREAKIAGNIRHDNIVHIYDFGEVEGRPYMVMEYLYGEDLRSAMKKEVVGDFPYRIHIALGIARAFEHIHSLGIVHRDLKPENIYLDAVGKVKLVDFGIAKSKDLSLTKAGFTLGTPRHMAPEQVRGAEVIPQVDVYAFGVLLFELFTGKAAIQGATVMEIFDNILNKPIDLEPLERCGAGPRMVSLVRRLVMKKPEERPQGFPEIRKELESISEEMEAGTYDYGRPKTPSVATTDSDKRNRRLLISAVTVATIALLLVLYSVFRLTSSAPEEQVKGGSVPEGMALIPAGPFPFGEAGEIVELPAYYIDRCEVSNRDYGEFARATGHRTPSGLPEEPVANITVDDARAFARWAGKRLPSAQEWERAARGPEGRLYPWGNQHVPGNANVADNPGVSERRVMPTESMPEGASQYGVLHLAGNVREFVLEFAAPDADLVKRFALLLAPPPTAQETWCIIRGGSYDKPLMKNAGFASELVPARYAAETIGFRCVKDAR